MKTTVQLESRLPNRWAQRFNKQKINNAIRTLAPTLFALAFASVAHAQGTMDFSGAQTLMGTFKTFAVYAGAVICFGGLIFAGIRMMSGRFQEMPSPAYSVRCLVQAYLDGARAGSDLIRSEIHPMEEAQGFRALLDLEDPKYSIEQIAAKVGKTPAFVAQRLKLKATLHPQRLRRSMPIASG